MAIQIGLIANGATFEWLVYLKSPDFKWANTSWQPVILIPDWSSANRPTIPKPNHLNTSLPSKGPDIECFRISKNLNLHCVFIKYMLVLSFKCVLNTTTFIRTWMVYLNQLRHGLRKSMKRFKAKLLLYSKYERISV